MSVQHGVCDFGYTPDGAVIDAAWARHTRAFGVGLVRTPITTAADRMPTGLLREALEVYGAEGVVVHGEFTPAFLPTAASVGSGDHANMFLNTSGDMHTSPYIDAVTLRAMGVGRQAYKSGLRTVIFGNEPNVALVKAGAVVPPGLKGGALHPAIASALYFQAAARLHEVGLACFNGALSVLPQGGLDGANPYYAAWLRQFYTALVARGQFAPYPWAGWAVNMEGAWAPGTFNSALHVLRSVMGAFKDTGVIRLTEWGWGNGAGVDAGEVASTLAAIDGSEVVSATFFQGPGKEPYTGDPARYAGKGAWQWAQNGRRLIAGADYHWAAPLRAHYTPRPASRSANGGQP